MPEQTPVTIALLATISGLAAVLTLSVVARAHELPPDCEFGTEVAGGGDPLVAVEGRHRADPPPRSLPVPALDSDRDGDLSADEIRGAYEVLLSLDHDDGGAFGQAGLGEGRPPQGRPVGRRPTGSVPSTRPPFDAQVGGPAGGGQWFGAPPSPDPFRRPPMGPQAAAPPGVQPFGDSRGGAQSAPAQVGTQSVRPLEGREGGQHKDLPQGVARVSPSEAAADGPDIRLQIELDPNSRPPLPPAQIQPAAVRVGGHSATAVKRNGNTVTAMLSLPAESPAGPMDVVVEFRGPTPGVMVRALGKGSFTVVGGEPAALVPVGAGDDVSSSLPYVVVDTGQATCYDDRQEIKPPAKGQPFHGQDAQYRGPQPTYRDNGDGTVSDLNTGLMWQKDPGEKHTHSEATAGAGTLRLGGYDDWRLPTIKELYSLIDFRGSIGQSRPYIDTRSFVFKYPDTSDGTTRNLDAQYWSSTQYVGTTMRGAATVFGVNFADGRIKGYPRDRGRNGSPMKQFVRYVRGNPAYGRNEFVDNGDGTVTDRATGLMWQKGDSGKPMDWKDALAYAEGLRCGGHDDWRLPNAKELQSIVDYTHAPEATDPRLRGPALDPVFDLTDPQSWFWSSTTHLDHNASFAVYIAFGQAFGVFTDRDKGRRLVDVHGAGAQRSDPKSGDPARWADGFGPQRDQRRVLNYVRAVRGGVGD